MTTSSGRKTIAYLVKCALASNDSLVKADQNGNNYTFAGGIGLCPAWKNGGVSTDPVCMEGLSACIMAHVNTAGVHVPLWLDSSDAAIGWGIDRTNFPMQEGTFFGDILDTGVLTNLSKPSVTAPVAYFCDGAGFPAGASGVVAGRLGASQSGAPYVNPFGNGALCQNNSLSVGQFSNGVGGSCPSGSNSNPGAGCPDGYKALTTNGNGAVWQHGITVWRNNNYTPVFDTSYQYALAPTVTQGMVVDCGTNPIQQYGASAKLPTSVFNMTATGSNWTLAPASNPGQCLDAGAGTNGTGIAMASCNGSAQQAWSISPDVQSGNFFVKVTSTNRCMTVRGANTAAGAVMEVDDCASSTSQKFAIQATVIGSDTSNQTGTGGSTGGTTGTGGSGGTPTFASSRTYRMVPQHATGESIDVSNNSQTNGTAVQQYGSWGTPSQAFYLLPSGSDWKIAMSSNQNKCIGPSNNGTANSTLMVIQDCNGSTAQAYTAMPMSASGVYAFKNVASGRCLNIQGASTANAARLQLWDCGTTPGTNAQFSMQ
jgi:hypothetical protein